MGRAWAGVVLASGLLVAGCGDGDVSGAGDVDAVTVPQLDGTAWQATSITENGTARPIVPGSNLRLEFRDAAISIHAGCNGMGGDYTLSTSGELRVGTLSGTMMACAPPLMEQDAWLSGTVFAEPLVASGDQSTLMLSREGLELVFADRGVATPDASLEGTVWQLDGTRSGDSVASVPSGIVSTLTLAEGGVVTVDTGCNRGTGTVTRTGDTLAFDQLALTPTTCADDAARQTDSAVLGVLGGDVHWTVTDRTLTLTKGDRGLVYQVSR